MRAAMLIPVGVICVMIFTIHQIYVFQERAALNNQPVAKTAPPPWENRSEEKNIRAKEHGLIIYIGPAANMDDQFKQSKGDEFDKMNTENETTTLQDNHYSSHQVIDDSKYPVKPLTVRLNGIIQ